MTTAIIIDNPQTTLATMPQVATAFDVLLYSLSSASKRQYQHTFKAWASFAADNGFRPVDISPQNLIAFLNCSPLAHKTKTARLSHLRKLLQTMHAQQPDNIQLQSWYQQVQLLKVKRD